jgi:hypothetical protein
MRRGLTIFLILFFGLGPLAAALASNDESRLPPCCRRHGKHHCAMAAMMAKAASGKANFSAPSTCSSYPGNAIPVTASTDALAAAPVSLALLLLQAPAPAALSDAIRPAPLRNHAGRSPPASISLG